MSNEIRIDCWSTTRVPWAPPGTVRLHGRVTGHPYKPDGSEVTTSPVAEVKGRTITTRSGNIYRLGTIDPRYRKWLADNGIPYDARNPIVDRGEEGPQWQYANRSPGGVLRGKVN